MPQEPYGDHVVGENWLLPENETASLTIASVTVEEDTGIVGLCHPVTENDAGGPGALRRLRCQCWGKPQKTHRCGSCRVRKRSSLLKQAQLHQGLSQIRQLAWPVFGMTSGAHDAKLTMLRGWRLVARRD